MEIQLCLPARGIQVHLHVNASQYSPLLSTGLSLLSIVLRCVEGTCLSLLSIVLRCVDFHFFLFDSVFNLLVFINHTSGNVIYFYTTLSHRLHPPQIVVKTTTLLLSR